VDTNASTDSKAASDNSAFSANMTMGILGRSCLISEAISEPCSRLRLYSSTTASTGSDARSCSPSCALAAGSTLYPFFCSTRIRAGSRWMHSRAGRGAIWPHMYHYRVPRSVHNCTPSPECQGTGQPGPPQRWFRATRAAASELLPLLTVETQSQGCWTTEYLI